MRKIIILTIVKPKIVTFELGNEFEMDNGIMRMVSHGTTRYMLFTEEQLGQLKIS